MAGPVGHIVCAVAFLNSGMMDMAHKRELFLGTSFPDIRYIVDIRRSTTHKLDGEGIDYVLQGKTPFEIGRRLHVFIDIEREKYMRDHDAYRFIKNGPLKTQMLKIVEDQIMFKKLDDFKPEEVFTTVLKEEREYAVSESDVQTWHNLLKIYLNRSYWFNAVRYYKSLMAFQQVYGIPRGLFDNFWQSLKTFGFFIYAYIQVENLSRNQELKAIILDFYEKKIQELIEQHRLKMEDQAVQFHKLMEQTLLG